MNNLISVIVPVFNTEKYLPRCIDSILKQSYPNIEIIIVNDGSNDKSEKVCLSYTDNRIKYFKKTNGGLSDARNFGIDRANGSFICFVDSDDYLNVDYLKELKKAIEQGNCSISMCLFKQFSGNNVENEGYEPANIKIFEKHQFAYLFSSQYYPNIVVAWNKLYKRELFDSIRYPKGFIHEDEATTYKLLFESGKIAIIDAQLYYYFINNNGITKSKITIDRLSYLDFMIDRFRYMNSIGDSEFAKLTVKNAYYYFVMMVGKSKDDVSDYRLFFEELTRKYKKIKPLLLSRYSRFDIRIVVLLSLSKKHLLEQLHLKTIKALVRLKRSKNAC